MEFIQNSSFLEQVGFNFFRNDIESLKNPFKNIKINAPKINVPKINVPKINAPTISNNISRAFKPISIPNVSREIDQAFKPISKPISIPNVSREINQAFKPISKPISIPNVSREINQAFKPISKPISIPNISNISNEIKQQTKRGFKVPVSNLNMPNNTTQQLRQSFKQFSSPTIISNEVNMPNNTTQQLRQSFKQFSSPTIISNEVNMPNNMIQKLRRTFKPVSNEVKQAFQPVSNEVNMPNNMIQKLRRSFKPVSNEVKQAFQPVSNEVKQAFQPVANEVKQAFQPISDPAKIVVPNSKPINNNSNPVIINVAPKSQPIVNNSNSVTTIAPKSQPIVNNSNSVTTIGPESQPIVNNSNPVTTIAPKSQPIINNSNSVTTITPKSQPMIDNSSVTTVTPIYKPMNVSTLSQPVITAKQSSSIVDNVTPSSKPMSVKVNSQSAKTTIPKSELDIQRDDLDAKIRDMLQQRTIQTQFERDFIPNILSFRDMERTAPPFDKLNLSHIAKPGIIYSVSEVLTDYKKSDDYYEKMIEITNNYTPTEKGNLINQMCKITEYNPKTKMLETKDFEIPRGVAMFTGKLYLRYLKNGNLQYFNENSYSSFTRVADRIKRNPTTQKQNETPTTQKQDETQIQTERKMRVEMKKISEDRMNTLNVNNIKRNAEYWKIGTVCLIEVVFLVVLSFLNFPTSILFMLGIITGGGVMIYSINSLISINARDAIYYDELALEPPARSSDGSAISSASKTNENENALGASNVKICNGNACCSKTTSWNKHKNQCEKIKDGFSTIESAYNKYSNIDRKEGFSAIESAYNKYSNIDRKEGFFDNKIDDIVPFQINGYDSYGKI